MNKIAIFCLLLFYLSVGLADTVSDSNRLFNWAETKYPQLFSPGGAESFELLGYWVRYYPQTDTYVGTQNNSVYVYGDVFGGLLYINELDVLMQDVERAGSTVNLSDYLPLQVGNSWNFIEYTASDTTEFSRHQILATEQIEGLTVFQDAYFENQNELTEATLLAVQDERFHYVGERRFVQDDNLIPGLYLFDPSLSVPLLISVGDMYRGDSSLVIPQGNRFDLSWSFQFRAHADNVSLQSGRVYEDCISFILSQTVLSETSRDLVWLCKGIGEIKSVETSSGDTEELLDFSLPL